MSTVQRRTRKLFQYGIVRAKVELNYKKLGFRSGLLHVYLKNGNVDGIAKQVSLIKGMKSTTVHIGNSDIVGEIVYKDRYEILKLISGTKKILGVERVVWSEEVYTIPSNNSKFDLSAYLPKKLSDMLF